VPVDSASVREWLVAGAVIETDEGVLLVRNLRRKFGDVGAGDVVETKAGVGYRLGPCLGGAEATS